MAKEKGTIVDGLKKLEGIVSWFQENHDIDLEVGLKKVREGAQLVQDLKGKLQNVENEFSEIKKTLVDSGSGEV
jgi:exodeoxyribonuclease VII small subunit